nr:reverse transcriptase domain-containing protein [Tanacetum cinerariifolium]
MSTRSSARNLFPPLENPELTIRKRSRVDPNLLNDFEMATDGNSDPPVLDLQTMEELRQPTLNGRGGPIAPIAIPATNFGLKNDMIQQPNQKPSIPYPSILHEQKLHDKTNDQKEKISKIFQDLNFNISFADALILMPKFGPTIKSLLTNKDKLFKLARTPLNEHCSAILLKKLPEKLGDPSKFTIPCDFSGIDECLALDDLGVSINLMPLSVWNKLSLPELTPTLMTLELADRSISRPIGVAKDVFVKTGRALIDVYAGELTLRVNNEAVTFNLDQTSRYSANYDDMMANRIDVIDMAYEEYSQEVLSFYDVIVSSNPTPYYDPIVSTSSPTLTPFGDSDFLLEEVDAFLALEDDPTSPKVDHSYYDTEGDILLLEAFLKDDPSLPPPTQGMYLHLSVEEKANFIKVWKSHKQAIAWKLSDIKDPKDQEKTTFTCLYGTFAYRRMPFGLCNAPGTFQRCMMAIFYDMIEKMMEVFMNNFSVFRNSFGTCLSHLDKMLQQCEDTNLCLNWEKSHFMVKEGIVLGHKISKNGIEVDKAKVDVITKLPHPTIVKVIHSFLGHVGFYRRFIQDFSKIAWLMTRLLEKDTSFFFSKECVKPFKHLREN